MRPFRSGLILILLFLAGFWVKPTHAGYGAELNYGLGNLVFANAFVELGSQKLFLVGGLGIILGRSLPILKTDLRWNPFGRSFTPYLSVGLRALGSTTFGAFSGGLKFFFDESYLLGGYEHWQGSRAVIGTVVVGVGFYL